MKHEYNCFQNYGITSETWSKAERIAEKKEVSHFRSFSDRLLSDKEKGIALPVTSLKRNIG